MAAPLSAFGIFAHERAASCTDVAVGVEACYAGGVLAFWSGPYFVKLTSFKDTAGIYAALSQVAASIAAALGLPGARPSQLEWIPTKNLVPRSIKRLPKHVLGQSSLTNAFEAQDQDGPTRAGSH